MLARPAVARSLLSIGAPLALIVLICAATAAQPDLPLIPADKVHIPGVDRDLAVRLADADRLAAEKQWQEAVDAYLELIREHGDDLVPVDPAKVPLATGQRFVQARWLVHQHIAGLPDPAWAAYSKRLDGIAKRWLEQAMPTRDVRQLRRIVEDAFCSRPAIQALELLGDLAFERGNFAEAQHWWRLLARPLQWTADDGRWTVQSENDPLAIVHRPPPADRARVRAKQILALLFQEQADRVPAELKAYRTVHGSATGTLGARNGNYADTIELLRKQGQGSLPAAEQEWPTFAGDPSRHRALPVAVSPRLWANGPAWRVRLDTGQRVPDSEAAKQWLVDSAQVAETKKGAAFFPPSSQSAVYPIISKGVAYVADARFVRGYDLRTGQSVFQFDLMDSRKVAGGDEIHFKLPAPPGLHCTMTAADGYLCTRLGAPWFGPVVPGGKREAESWLVCWKVADAAGKPPTLCWAVPALRQAGEQVIFEGAPLIHERAVYIARSRLQGVRTATVICCFDAATGATLWEQEVCDAPEFPEGTPSRCRHHLLTLAGPNIIYSSHAGAIFALEAATGKRAWAVRYPSRGLKTRDGQPSPRDLCPPMAAADRVVVAPADFDRLLCLESTTGRSLWEREGIEVVHLLGLTHDRVLFTTMNGLRAVNAMSGGDEGGWRQPLLGNLASQGRGLLADGWVFWPTRDAKQPWRAVRFHDGGLMNGVQGYDAGMLRPLATGNVALGHGCLVIAGAEELLGYVQPQPPLGPPQT